MPEISVPEIDSDESVEVTSQPAESFKITGPVGCEIVVAIHYIEDGSDLANATILTKEFKGKTFIDIVSTIQAGLQRLNSRIKPKGGFLVKIHCRKLIVTGFSDACGTYQHERAMSAVSALIYLIAAGVPVQSVMAAPRPVIVE